MRILVTGVTGYLGGAIGEALRTAGHSVVALVRTAARAVELADRYEIVPGDLSDGEAIARALPSVDAVVHAAMAAGEAGPALDRLAIVNIVDTLAGTGKPLVYTSGVWVYGDTHGRMLGELGVLHPPEHVAWRPAVEQIVLGASERGVRGMVVRPGVVFGRGGGLIGAMVRQARAACVVRIVGDGANHWSCVHVDDLADLYVRMVAAPAPGELFLACGGMPQPVGKIALAVARHLGPGHRVEHIPLEQARREMGSLADCLALDQKLGSTKAARYFGWPVRHPSLYDELFTGSYSTL
jgi:nucleoside-diphosphate-sugar epimerase